MNFQIFVQTKKNMLTRHANRWSNTFKYLHYHKIPTFMVSTTQSSVPSQAGPPPIRVGLTESSGRGVFATQPIAAGELIHTAKPIVAHPLPGAIDRVCYFCLRRIGSFANCDSKVALFCSEKCENEAKAFYEVEKTADWLNYDDYCRTRALKYPLLVKRLACMVISGAASAAIIDILQPAELSREMILKMEEGFSLLKNTFMKANIEERKMTFLTNQWYSGALARIRINAFRVDLAGSLNDSLHLPNNATAGAEAAVGHAVYMLPSFYNHDCDPNAHILWTENADADLMALRDVKLGEELRICYIDASVDRDARQTLLSQGFGFECNCLRCASGD